MPQQPPRSPRALLRNPREDQIPEGPVEVVVSLDDNRRANIVFGLYDQNIAHIERRLGVIATVNGNRVTVRGDMLGTDQAKRVIDSLYELARRQLELSTGDVDGMIA
ncbi:MAG: phosphate starvation-inducible protein PhoH, partial [Rhizobiales bacterium]|nr:phosphate starvation-inducible protein PhoH [Hyphomicrobiales bacterium]